MKKLICTFSLVLAGMFILHAQSSITISGTVYDMNSGIGIPGQTLTLFTDSIYNPATSSYWMYNSTTASDSGGFYYFPLTIPAGITSCDIYVVLDCGGVVTLTTVTFPSGNYDSNDFFCGKQTNTCMAGFSYLPDYANKLKYYFYDYSLGNISSWNWDFGDGITSSLQNPDHTYAKDGIYLVSLRITDTTNACTDSTSMYLNTQDSIIYPGCKAYFYYYPDYADSFTIYFATDSLNYSTVYTWDLGDNTSATGNFVTHTYSAKGKYQVCLTLYDSLINCTDTFCEIIEIPYKTPCYSFFYYNINGDTVTFYADQKNSGTMQATYNWDFGDGTGDSDTSAVKTHVYAKKGAYTVCMTAMTANDTCIQYCDYISTDSIVYNDGYIAGFVILDKVMADFVTVYLISYNEKDSTISALDSTVTDSGGFFMFYNLAYQGYYLKAAMQAKSAYYKDYLPTYYDTSVYWDQAIEVEIYPNGLPVWAEIHMIKGNNPGGPGFIGGKVSKGSNMRSDQFPGIPVILLDGMGKAVAYTYSDEDGNFAFNDLALGNYKVYADYFGIECEELSLELTESNKTVTNVEIVVNKTGIVVSLGDLIEGLVETAGKLFPNPADNQINLKLMALQNVNVRISIFNLLGKEVYTDHISVHQGQNLISIPLEDLEKGVYILNLNVEGKGQLNYRFIK